jgi:plastocyanin
MLRFGNATRRHGGVWLVLMAAVCVMLATTFALAQSEKEDDKVVTVTIDNFSFSPETLTIKPGTKVKFVNHDDIPHTVVAVDKTFRSKVMDTDESYEFTFVNAGSIDYFCSLHPHMTAKIVVAP